MTTTRDAFEAHVNTFASKDDSPSTRFELCYTGAYENSWVQLAWLYWQSAWQAATLAERERCAKVCETVDNEQMGKACIGHNFYGDYAIGSELCTAAIRSGK